MDSLLQIANALDDFSLIIASQRFSSGHCTVNKQGKCLVIIHLCMYRILSYETDIAVYTPRSAL